MNNTCLGKTFSWPPFQQFSTVCKFYLPIFLVSPVLSGCFRLKGVTASVLGGVSGGVSFLWTLAFICANTGKRGILLWKRTILFDCLYDATQSAFLIWKQTEPKDDQKSQNCNSGSADWFVLCDGDPFALSSLDKRDIGTISEPSVYFLILCQVLVQSEVEYITWELCLHK